MNDLKTGLEQTNSNLQKQLHQLELDYQQARINADKADAAQQKIIHEQQKAQKVAKEIAKKEATDQFNKKTQEVIDQTDQTNQELADNIKKWNDQEAQKNIPKIVPNQQRLSSIFTLLKGLITKKNLWPIAGITACFGALLLIILNASSI
jgi:hypothetical protein